ncbi:LytTR family two component transcriptional regulator [Neolewinella xylanilytica]|uniref:LytTR family two component transcriptional regulator n=1 Tax=Neolewinella xylanilytica TaxID=1514080 RepID=A0A2S6IAJ5_9BACT|nr:LytTR family DNA-binding domain-containing protein [Neolewinella xylanilytica]PPK88527.1 LytTR family two component transcriptional regulator [Neolewinella xylanilytica]
MLLNAVIVEDERKGLVNLKQMLNLHCPDVEVIGEADGVESGCALFGRDDIRPDIAFLDINLGDGKVFQMLDRIKPINFDIVFVTAYDQFAMRAFDYSAIGYILKPIDPDRLVDAVARIRPRGQARTQERLDAFQLYQKQPNVYDRMPIGAVDGYHFIRIPDIIRFEAEDNYTHIYMADGQRITASKTIKMYEDMLAPHNFYRVHKRHVINMNYMKKFVKGEGGYLIMDDGMRIEVSRRRRSAFMSQLRFMQEL